MLLKMGLIMDAWLTSFWLPDCCMESAGAAHQHRGSRVLLCAAHLFQARQGRGPLLWLQDRSVSRWRRVVYKPDSALAGCSREMLKLVDCPLDLSVRLAAASRGSCRRGRQSDSLFQPSLSPAAEAALWLAAGRLCEGH